MVKQYLIDNKIIFSPTEQKLLSVESGKKRILHSNVSRCLELLILQQGTVISQNELILHGWGKDAYGSVTTAAYYQCFVNLRKNLKELDYYNELVVTIRRIGIKIEPSIDISTIDYEKDVISDVSDKLEATDAILPIPYPVIRKLENFTGKTKMLMAVFIVIVLIFLSHTINSTSALQHDVEGFTKIENSPPCFLYNIKNVDNLTPTKFMIDKNHTCDDGKYYYISYFSASPRLSYFICGKVKESFCESFTHIVHLK